MKHETSHLNQSGVIYTKTNGVYGVYSDHRKVACRLSSALSKELNEQTLPIVGDQVYFTCAASEQGLMITKVLPRRNALARRAAGTRRPDAAQMIAANIDLIIPVFAAAQPAPHWNLLDRYLAAAEADHIPALICITKLDLSAQQNEAEQTQLRQMVRLYEQIGYPAALISAQTGEGMETFRAALSGKTVLLIGKSGVGKTSLLNALEPGLGKRVQAVSSATGKGRHTTTQAEMFPLDSGGAIIDTPGMREFGLSGIFRDDLALNFPEMRPIVGTCKFGLDCQHDEEPGCAIRKAVMNGQIHPLRYRSYLKMKEDLP